MGIKLLFLLLILFTFKINAQNDTIKFWVQFTDKQNSEFSISNPSQFLSERAIERRSNQNISIIENDLPVNKKYIDSVLNLGNFNLQNQSKWFNAITISTNDSANITILNNVSFVQSIKNVQFIQKEYNDEFSSFENATSKQVIVQSCNQEHYPYGKTYKQLELHKVTHLHEYGFKGQGMHIAVIDAGFLNVNTTVGLEHLFNENRILSTKDFVDHDDYVYDAHFHGAAVLSIIAGYIPGEYFGSAPFASFHLLRSEDSESELIVEEDNWIAAAEYADSVGADIINTSLGYTQFDDPSQNHTYNDLDGNTTRIAIASDIAASKGLLLVTSAGNSGNSPWKYISTPADADSVLTIAAVNEKGERADFSSVGPSSDGDIKPNIASVGWDTYYISPYSSKIERGNGTSFSAPMVTGMVACLWQGLPNYTNMEVIKLIEQSATQYNNPDSLIGYGIPNFSKAYSLASGVIYEQPKNKIISIYPNPFNQITNFEISSNTNQTIVIQIKDYLGQPIKSIVQLISNGRNLITISSMADWNEGVYILTFNFEDGTSISEKVVKL